MDAITILRNIIEDGYLSDTNMHRDRRLLDTMDSLKMDHATMLEICRADFRHGNKIEAIKRFRSFTGCGLVEARDAVAQGVNFI